MPMPPYARGFKGLPGALLAALSNHWSFLLSICPHRAEAG